MASYSAGYLGGDPAHPAAVEEGELEADEGGIRFSHRTMANMMPRLLSITIDAAEITAVRTDDGSLKRKGMGVAVVTFGVAGAIAHSQTTAKRNMPIQVEAAREGQQFVATFATDPRSVAPLLADLARQRAVLGLAQVGPPPPPQSGAPRPPVPQPAPPPPPFGPSAEDALALIGRLGDLRDAGHITDADFEAKKAELLRRV